MAKSTVLEFTILSAEDLRIDGRSVKKNAFALVKTDLYNSKPTRADSDGGSHPHWNEKLVVGLLERTPFVTVEVHCKVRSKNRVVGAARVPVSDFFGDPTPENYRHFLSYRLLDPRGVKNGIVNFSVRVIEGGGGGGGGWIGDYGCLVAAAGRKKEAAGRFGGGYSRSYSWDTTAWSWAIWTEVDDGNRCRSGGGGRVVTDDSDCGVDCCQSGCFDFSFG
ncbi:BON1-associated protein 2 [Linum grandiflorum]